MASSGMLRRVALVRTDVSEELCASFIRVTRIGELGNTLAVNCNRRTLRRLLVRASVVPSSPILVTLMKEALSCSETSVLTRGVRRNIPKDAILHSHRHENLKSYKFSYVQDLLSPVTFSVRSIETCLGSLHYRPLWLSNRLGRAQMRCLL
jgi:hypothetical protein